MFTFSTNGVTGSASPAALAVPGSPTQGFRGSGGGGGASAKRTKRRLRLKRKHHKRTATRAAASKRK